MAGESAKVEVLVQGDDDRFWNVVYINGFEINTRLVVESIEAGKAHSDSLRKIAQDDYRLGYRQGFASCQHVICDALGVRK